MTKSKKSLLTQNNPTSPRLRGTRVLAIDPGFDRVGVAILEGTSSKQALLFSECISTNKKETHAERIKQIGIEIRKVIKDWSPEYLAIEKLFFNQNTTSAIRVAEARGVIIYEASLASLTISEYSPQEIKIATTGYGKAAKNEVETMVMKLLEIKILPKLDDEVDAIAVGITHLASHKLKSRLSP